MHFLNGKLVQEKDLLISPRDLGFARGYAVFDFLITYGGRPFMLERHIERLLQSAKLISLPVPWSKKQIVDWVKKTVAQNRNGEEKSTTPRINSRD